MAAISLPPPGVRPVSPFPETLARCQLKVARLYLSRARVALLLARVARDEGRTEALAGHLATARHWRRIARDWTAKAVRP
jgi:hypothetical protein